MVSVVKNTYSVLKVKKTDFYVMKTLLGKFILKEKRNGYATKKLQYIFYLNGLIRNTLIMSVVDPICNMNVQSLNACLFAYSPLCVISCL